jgi:non-specific serine/threonine protein kinase
VQLNCSVTAIANLPECFEALARLAQDERDDDRAVRLWAASDALRDELGQPVPPIHWPDLQRRRSELRRALGRALFEGAWSSGHALPLEAALQFALADTRPSPASQQLSQRERDVARCIARGLTNRQIADELVLSERTVDAHCRHIFDKLSVTSRTQVATWAVTSGLLAAE